MYVKSIIYALSLLLMGTGVAAKADVLNHDYRTLAGKERVNLQKTYAGKVVLVVNTASKCGFTPQFEALEAMNAKYPGQRLRGVGFPSNDFMGQDPGSEKEIKEFCTLTYGVKFPMLRRSTLKAMMQRHLSDLKEATGDVPGWNFHKFLIDRKGNVIGSFPK